MNSFIADDVDEHGGRTDQTDAAEVTTESAVVTALHFSRLLSASAIDKGV